MSPAEAKGKLVLYHETDRIDPYLYTRFIQYFGDDLNFLSEDLDSNKVTAMIRDEESQVDIHEPGVLGRYVGIVTFGGTFPQLFNLLDQYPDISAESTALG